jgi:hypothetical protein
MEVKENHLLPRTTTEGLKGKIVQYSTRKLLPAAVDAGQFKKR